MEDLGYDTDIALVSYRFQVNLHLISQLNCGARIALTSGMQPKYLILPWCHGRLHLCLLCQLKTFQILLRSGMECALCGLFSEVTHQKNFIDVPVFFRWSVMKGKRLDSNSHYFHYR